MSRHLPVLLAALGVATWATARPLRYAEDRAPAIVNPLFATSMSEARLHELMFEGLYVDDFDLRSVPRLVAADAVSADRMGMAIQLKQDLKWQDGAPLTAADVVFTIQAMQEPRTASSESAQVGWIRTAQVIDPYTVALSFTEPQASPADRLQFKILPAHLFGSTVVDRAHPFRTQPVGSGPFKLSKFNADNSITLVPNAGYGRPNSLGEVQLREVADKSYQSKLLLYGSLEALVRVLPRDLATLQADRSVDLYPYQTNSWWYLGFHLSDPRFADVRVREALSLLIDRNALLAPIGTGDLLSGPFVKSSPFYDHSVPARTPDPARGRALLEAAGWRWVNDRWEKGGAPLEVRITALARQETAQDVVINLQSQLRAHGITARQDFLTTAEWKQRVWTDKDFDIVLSQWSFDRNEDIHEQFHSTGDRNFSGFADAEVDRLLDAARDATDPQQKRDTLRQVHARVAALTPMVFLWSLDNYAAMSTDVQGVTVHPFYFFTWATSWRLD